MYKLILRNYNRKRGKVIRETDYLETMKHYIKDNKYDLIDKIEADEDNFLDLERNNDIVQTAYNYDIECYLEYMVDALERIEYKNR